MSQIPLLNTHSLSSAKSHARIARARAMKKLARPTSSGADGPVAALAPSKLLPHEPSLAKTTGHVSLLPLGSSVYRGDSQPEFSLLDESRTFQFWTSNRCPYCGSLPTLVRLVEPLQPVQYLMKCSNATACAHKTPLLPSRDDAIRQWKVVAKLCT